MGCEAVGEGVGDAGSGEIGDCHGVAAGLTGHGGGEEADGAGTEDKG